jgi:superfamily I DNA and RNA helicase
MQESDFTGFEQRLIAREAFRDDLKRKLADRKSNAKRLIEVRSLIATVIRESEDEEQKQMETFVQAASELNTLRNPDLSKRLISPDRPNLSKLEE